MKLATYKDGSRDGQLIVVSRDLRTAHYATGIAHRLQQVLDDWGFLAPQLQDVYDALNAGRARHVFDFNPEQCMAPLPRAYQWLNGTAYPSHAELTQRALGLEPVAPGLSPAMYQGSGDDFLGPCDDVAVLSDAMGVDFGAGLAVVTADVRLGTSPEDALDAVRLLTVVDCISLRQLAPAELDKRCGWVQSKPATAFAPVAVTLDEVGEAWRHGRVHLTLQTSWNGRKVGMCDAGADMGFHFGQLIAHAAATRHLRAGTVVGCGTVANAVVDKKGNLDWPKGYGCIADKRGMEILQNGEAKTDYLQLGDSVRIDMKGKDGASLCGAIDHNLVSVQEVRTRRTRVAAAAAAAEPAAEAEPV
ncbi:fumarylacetoacetate hydrolase family protein [Comamonas humi]